MQTFRDYPDDPSSSIYQHYYNKNTKQTLAWVRNKIALNNSRPKISLSITEALATMNDYQDPSDPDTDANNLIHAYQTAERIRKDYPDEKWFQVTGLIHDTGKILYKFGEDDFAVVGDTFPVGCQHSELCVYSQFFKDNPDTYDTIGIYSPHCGLDSLIMTWGHDEYLYQVLINNQNNLPSLARRIIRYHSFYPLHRAGAYTQFLSEEDLELIPWLKKFSDYDLYTKHDAFILTDEIQKYYSDLLAEFFPSLMLW
jgi:inositol oxygenase